MAQEFRIDSHRIDARSLRKDVHGFAVVSSWATRAGVFEYTRSDGSKIRELRHPDDVFHPAHLESLTGASVTVGHPAENVSPSNVRTLEVGVVASARRDGKFVAADLSIREAAAIGKVERGELVELSLGYSLKIDPTPGVFEGQRYDAIQRDLRVNHCALLPLGGGRAGREVRLRMDSHSSVLLSTASTFYDERSGTMSSREDAVQSRVDAVTKKFTDANLPEGTPSLYDRQRMSQDERLAAAERRLTNRGKVKR